METPNKAKKGALATPFSPLDMMEKMANRDSELLQCDFTPAYVPGEHMPSRALSPAAACLSLMLRSD